MPITTTGLEAQLPAFPKKGDRHFSTDTVPNKVRHCFVDGTWVQIIPAASAAGGDLLGFGGTGVTGAQKRWADGDNANAPASTDFPAQIEMTKSGTLKNLRVARAAPGVGDSIVYTVHIGGIATGIT
jgi:hypothetical protein